MIKNIARRFAMPLVLGVTAFATTGIAHADGVTGTDPCPKALNCAVPSSSSVSVVTPAGTSNPAAMAQALLVFLGLA